MNNLLGLVIEKYASQWCNIIQPKKLQNYDELDLGLPVFQLNTLIIAKIDFYVTNYQGYILPATLYLPQNQNARNCVLYLHANNGSRLSGAAIKEQILTAGFAYAIFDFSGAGKSNGKFSTLGLNEAGDILCMGAFAALYLTIQYPYLINGLVLDTPYYSIKQLFIYVISKRYHLPNFLIESVLDYLNQKIIAITSTQLFNIDLLDQLKNHSELPPCFFATSNNDNLIPKEQVSQIYQNYPGRKKFVEIEGTHSQQRNNQFLIKACKFLNSLIKEQIVRTERSQSLKSFNYIQPIYIQKPILFCQFPQSSFKQSTQIQSYQQPNLSSLQIFYSLKCLQIEINTHNIGYFKSSPISTQNNFKNEFICIQRTPLITNSIKQVTQQRKLSEFFNFSQKVNNLTNKMKNKQNKLINNDTFKKRYSEIVNDQNSCSVIKHNSLSNIQLSQNQTFNYTLKTYFPNQNIYSIYGNYLIK